MSFLQQLQDAKRVADCLKKGLRIANHCMDTAVQVQLYVEILNFYVFFFEKGNEQVIFVTFFFNFKTFTLLKKIFTDYGSSSKSVNWQDSRRFA